MSLALFVVIAFIAIYFEPQSLLFDKKSAEVQKGQVISRSTTTKPESEQNQTSGTEPASKSPEKSSWISREHETTGEVFLTKDEKGNTYVRFENLDTDNGPDMKVYLAKSLSENGTPSDIVDLGALTANKGDANYLVPASVDINEYSHVVIWCKRFSVSFADATI